MLSEISKVIWSRNNTPAATITIIIIIEEVIFTEFELTVELFPVPANRVDAKGAFSRGRLHASIDHGALS